MEFLKNKNTKGLSLIELLVVVAVLGLLIVTLLIVLKPQLLKSRNARQKSDINKIKIAVEEYEKDNDCYPPPELVVCDPGTGLIPYLSKIPCNFVTGGSYYYETDDNDSCHSWYRIYSYLEYTQDPDVYDTICKFGCGPEFAYNYYQGSANAPLPSYALSPVVTPTPGATVAPSAAPDIYYGCKSGVCVTVYPDGSGKYCEPKFGNNTCYGQCTDPGTGDPVNECL